MGTAKLSTAKKLINLWGIYVQLEKLRTKRKKTWKSMSLKSSSFLLWKCSKIVLMCPRQSFWPRTSGWGERYLPHRDSNPWLSRRCPPHCACTGHPTAQSAPLRRPRWPKKIVMQFFCSPVRHSPALEKIENAVVWTRGCCWVWSSYASWCLLLAVAILCQNGQREVFFWQCNAML